MNKLTLTAEQKALIPVFIDKWQKIAFSTNETNKDIAIAAIKKVYSLINKPKPTIVFCDRHTLAEDVLFEAGLNNFGFSLQSEASDILIAEIEGEIKNKLDKKLYLVREIGYEKIERELSAEVIDYWQGYSLLKILIFDDWELEPEDYDKPLCPIHLLKETGNLQNKLNIVRVPSCLASVREAICWIKEQNKEQL